MKKKSVIKPASVLEEGHEKRLLELIGGAEPKTDAEKEMVKEIEAIKEKGHIISIPSSV